MSRADSMMQAPLVSDAAAEGELTARADVYAAAVIPQVKRLLGSLDREPASITYGSFDRDYWAWKFRDFPLGMMQVAAYPLSLVWRHPFAGSVYTGNRRLLEWLDGAIGATIARQHSNGAFDGFSPNEQNPGPTLGMAHGLSEALRNLGDALPRGRQEEIVRSVTKACEFALTREEDHAFVSNHWALFAVSVLNGFELTGRADFEKRANHIIDRILEHQSADGWYNEYDGPDPGYESLGIFHLAMYWKRTGSSRVLESLRRAVDFYSHFVHPDGSVGGSYGHRHVGLYFPGGFEILAGVIPQAEAIAAFMCKRLARGNVVTPAAIDMENLAPLSYAYLEAALAAKHNSGIGAPALPCEALRGRRRFAGHGISVVGTDSYYAVVNPLKGNACRVFDRSSGQVAYEDAGYLVNAGGSLWTTQLGGQEQSGTTAADAVVSEAQLLESRQELVTPVRFLVLRILNLTLFRSQTLGNRVRTMIVRRLITGRRAGPVRFRRTVVFQPDEILFEDQLRTDRAVDVRSVQLQRSYSSIHMGSAKYFQHCELVETVKPELTGIAEELRARGSATRRFTVRFDGSNAPRVVEDT